MPRCNIHFFFIFVIFTEPVHKDTIHLKNFKWHNFGNSRLIVMYFALHICATHISSTISSISYTLWFIFIRGHRRGGICSPSFHILEKKHFPKRIGDWESYKRKVNFGSLVVRSLVIHCCSRVGGTLSGGVMKLIIYLRGITLARLLVITKPLTASPQKLERWWNDSTCFVKITILSLFKLTLSGRSVSIISVRISTLLLLVDWSEL